MGRGLRWPCLIGSLCYLMPGIAVAQVGFATNLSDELSTVVDGFHGAEGFSGSVLVAVGDSVVLNRAWGMASVELGVPAETSHRYLVASVSKSFTAAAVLRLVDQGLLQLDATAAELLGVDLDPRITVHQLLTHTAGLHRDLLPGTGRTRREHFTTADRVGLVVAAGLRADPGDGYAYSSQGYVVLGAIVEAVAGAPLGEALETLVFEPLGMENTGLEVDGQPILGRAGRYIDLLGVLYPAVLEDPSFAAGAGSVSTTTADMLTFARALMEDGFLEPETRTLMMTDHDAGHGYGVRVFSYGTGPRLSGETNAGGLGFGYQGGTEGVAALFNVFVDHRVVVVILGNKTPLPTNRLSNAVGNVALGYPPPDLDVSAPDSFLADLVERGVEWGLDVVRQEAPDRRGALPTAGEAWQVAYGLFQHHRPKEAAVILRFLIELNPAPHYWSVLGQILWGEGESREACTAFAQARELDPGFRQPPAMVCPGGP